MKTNEIHFIGFHLISIKIIYQGVLIGVLFFQAGIS